MSMHNAFYLLLNSVSLFRLFFFYCFPFFSVFILYFNKWFICILQSVYLNVFNFTFLPNNLLFIALVLFGFLILIISHILFSPLAHLLFVKVCFFDI